MEIKEYILLCVQRAPEKKEKSYHWAVENIKGYAETYYRNELSLKQLANLYFINEKYKLKKEKESYIGILL